MKLLSFAVILIPALLLPVQPQKRVLIIGDSISIGYTPFVKQALGATAVVERVKGNAQHTGTGLKKIHEWLGDKKWDVIHFNWGLWDLCYRNPESTNKGKRDKVNGTITYSPETYEKKLRELVLILKETGATLIFATTTMVPDEEPGRVKGDDKVYNAVAMKVMKEFGVEINDLNTRSYGIHARHGLGNDDVHYTKEGYEELARPVIEHISKALGNRP